MTNTKKAPQKIKINLMDKHSVFFVSCTSIKPKDNSYIRLYPNYSEMLKSLFCSKFDFVANNVIQPKKFYKKQKINLALLNIVGSIGYIYLNLLFFFFWIDLGFEN